MNAPERRAVVLLSGGLDSATTLAIAREEGYETYTLAVDYGQRHRVELAAAEAISRQFHSREHRVVSIDLRAIGGSALTAEIEVPKDRPTHEIAIGIPVTYVPARNTVFLSVALGYAEVVGADAIFAGVNAVDYSGYPDCRPEFIAAFEQLAQVATKAGVEGTRIRIETPLIAMTKVEIVQHGVRLGVDYAQTVSCYDPNSDGRGCGRCDSCRIRREAFRLAGIADPTRYVG
ncbi:MAG: 7-cyano-7-deazaguanine synthase QueC [Fimbriimonadaceae bacterium]|nr:7-cyano-7-deazaguanine synthase QueC [Fimbriimonadaceae bacterium]